jgi:hypothetical protein
MTYKTKTAAPPSDIPRDESFLTEREVAQMLRVSTRTIARCNLQPVYVGRRKLYRKSHVLTRVLRGDC